MSDPLSVLIVGCGRIAGGFDERAAGEDIWSHAGAYTAHRGFRLVACVEPDATRRSAFMERWGIEHGFASLDDVRASGLAVDIASVCTPTAAHAAVLDALLAMPVRAVFAEKPLTADLAEARRLVAAYRAASRPLAVNYLRRWDAGMAALRASLAAGEWGLLQSVVAHYGKGVHNSGGHVVDLLHFLIGPLVPEAVFRRRFDFDRQDPTVDALLATADGRPVYLVGGDSRAFFAFEVDLMLAKGRVTIEELGRTIRLRNAVANPVFEGYCNLERGQWRDTALGRAMVNAVDNVARALSDGAPLLSDGESALTAQETCHTLAALAADLPPAKTVGDLP
jgi:predicted dehydrogenase